jgi:hypothetical protein
MSTHKQVRYDPLILRQRHRHTVTLSLSLLNDSLLSSLTFLSNETYYSHRKFPPLKAEDPFLTSNAYISYKAISQHQDPEK